MVISVHPPSCLLSKVWLLIKAFMQYTHPVDIIRPARVIPLASSRNCGS